MSDPQPVPPEVQEDLVAYLDGELEETQVEAVERRLSHSPTVRAEAESLQRVWELLDYLPRPRADESFTHRTMGRLTAMRTQSARAAVRWRWAGRIAWAAAVILTAVSSFLVVRHWPRPQPPQPSADEIGLLERRDYWHYYEQIDSVEFLRQLDQPDLFGEEP